MNSGWCLSYIPFHKRFHNKERQLLTRATLHVTSEKTPFFIVTALKTSNLTDFTIGHIDGAVISQLLTFVSDSLRAILLICRLVKLLPVLVSTAILGFKSHWKS
jgi:hypothetical protein